MSLTVPYTIELARRCEPYNVKWIEEFLPPDEYDGYAAVKQKVSTTDELRRKLGTTDVSEALTITG